MDFGSEVPIPGNILGVLWEQMFVQFANCRKLRKKNDVSYRLAGKPLRQ